MSPPDEQRRQKTMALVRRLRAGPGERRRVLKSRSSDPLLNRAVRIERHLRTLEEEILENPEQISVRRDTERDRTVICVRHDSIRCRRLAYLGEDEYDLLCSDARVRRILGRSQAPERVA